MLLSIDFEKAFDSVSHKFIKRILKLYNFGPSIQYKYGMRFFYNHANASILVDFFLSDTFTVERGCRQGDLVLICSYYVRMFLEK